MTTTYWVHADILTGKSTGPRAKYEGTSDFGYKRLEQAIKFCPEGSYVMERFFTPSDDWAGVIVFVNRGLKDSFEEWAKSVGIEDEATGYGLAYMAWNACRKQFVAEATMFETDAAVWFARGATGDEYPDDVKVTVLYKEVK